MTFRPMLAPNETPEFKTLRFPLLGSAKLDGISATLQNGRLLSRSLKEIPNKYVQERFTSLGLPDGMRWRADLWQLIPRPLQEDSFYLHE